MDVDKPKPMIVALPDRIDKASPLPRSMVKQADAQARALADAVKEGSTMQEALKVVSITPDYLRQNPMVLKKFELLCKDYRFSADQRKEFVRAALMQTALETEDEKTRLKALKLIGEDAEVGMYGSGGVTVNVADQMLQVQASIPFDEEDKG